MHDIIEWEGTIQIPIAAALGVSVVFTRPRTMLEDEHSEWISGSRDYKKDKV